MNSSKKKILFIAYYFPPMGMGGVVRTVKFLKYLPQFGYKPTVITVKPLHYHAFDKTLIEEIPEDINIIRTGSLEPLRILRICKEFQLSISGKKYIPPQSISASSKWTGNLLRSLFPPDEKILWHPFLIPTIAKEIKNNSYEAVFTTGPPESIHLAGYVINKISKIPWIADFRDAWSTNLLKKNLPSLTQRIDNYYESIVVNNSTVLITITEELREEFIKRYPHINSEKFITITNGYDPDELEWHERKRTTDKMTITHCGNFSSFQSASNFLQSIAELLSDYPAIEDDIVIRFIGAMKDDEIELIKNTNLSRLIEVVGYLPHRSALEEQLNSDVLLLIAHPEIEKTRILGKTFEYLWARRPILAVAPEGATVNLIKEENAGISVHPDDGDGIKSSILKLLDIYKTTGLPPTRPDNLERFSRVELTRKLADVLDGIVT